MHAYHWPSILCMRSILITPFWLKIQEKQSREYKGHVTRSAMTGNSSVLVNEDLNWVSKIPLSYLITFPPTCNIHLPTPYFSDAILCLWARPKISHKNIMYFVSAPHVCPTRYAALMPMLHTYTQVFTLAAPSATPSALTTSALTLPHVCIDGNDGWRSRKITIVKLATTRRTKKDHGRTKEAKAVNARDIRSQHPCMGAYPANTLLTVPSFPQWHVIRHEATECEISKPVSNASR